MTFTLDQRIMMVVDTLTKIKSTQRPQSVKRLYSVIASATKLQKSDETVVQQVCKEVVDEMIQRNLIVVVDLKVQYLFG